jgi:DNA-binding transcriptional MerR regulator
VPGDPARAAAAPVLGGRAPHGGRPAQPGADLTIDELARRTGMTVRNIRAHQSRGLLPAPEVRGRTGYYGAEHVARLELIKELQADGFNLEAIRRLVESAKGSTREVLDFTRAVRAPFEDEEPAVVEVSELAARFGDQARPELLERAVKLGLLRPLGDGRFEERSPRLTAAAEELARLGVDREHAMEVAERLRRHADGAARAFVELFVDEVWKPFVAAGRPEERWPEVRDALERLRPLAADSLLAMFQLVMTDRVEEAFGREIERELGKPSDQSSRPHRDPRRRPSRRGRRARR